MSDLDTIFITGTGRSGTNILKKIFAQNSRIASLPFEYRFIIDPDGAIDFLNTYPTSWSPYRADHLIKRLEKFLLSLATQNDEDAKEIERIKSIDPTGLEFSPPPYAGWELEKWIPGYSELVQNLIANIQSFSHRGIWPGTPEGVTENEMYFAPPLSKEDLKPLIGEFIRGCHSAIRNHQGKSIFQEDNTHNLLVAADLMELSPNSKLIHIVRDPRDVISSLQEQRWAPSKLEDLILWYKSVMNTWFQQRKLLDASRFTEVKFEDLMHDPQAQVTGLCGFAGIQFEHDMIDLDLSKHHSGRHKASFDSDQIEMLNSELSIYIEEYSYD